MLRLPKRMVQNKHNSASGWLGACIPCQEFVLFRKKQVTSKPKHHSFFEFFSILTWWTWKLNKTGQPSVFWVEFGGNQGFFFFKETSKRIKWFKRKWLTSCAYLDMASWDFLWVFLWLTSLSNLMLWNSFCVLDLQNSLSFERLPKYR